jgi:hypothetical protein
MADVQPAPHHGIPGVGSNGPEQRPVHVVIPEEPTAIVLFTDTFVEQRLRWMESLIALRLQAAQIAVVFVATGPARNAAPQRSFLPDGHRELATEVAQLVHWIHCRPDTRGLPVGLLAGPEGSFSTLLAASTAPALVGAVATVDGRYEPGTELAGQVEAPTLFVVSEGASPDVLATNELVFEQLRCEKELEVTPCRDGSSADADLPGCLELADLVTGWFAEHLSLGW